MKESTSVKKIAHLRAKSSSPTNRDTPGIWSEHTVGSVLWDIFDKSEPREGDMHLGLGFADIWAVLSGPFKARRNAGLIDFCDLLVERKPELAPKINALLASRNIQHKTGVAPGTDTPYHLPIGEDRTGTLDSIKTFPYKHFDESAFYTLRIEKKTKVTIDLEIVKSANEKHADLDLYLWINNKELKPKTDATKVKETESIVTVLEPGVYSVEIRSWAILVNQLKQPIRVDRNTATYRLRASVDEEK